MKTTKQKNYKQKDSETIHGKRSYRLRKDLEAEGNSEMKDYIYKQYPVQEIRTENELTDDEYAEISQRQLKALKLSMKHTIDTWEEELSKNLPELVKEFQKDVT